MIPVSLALFILTILHAVTLFLPCILLIYTHLLLVLGCWFLFIFFSLRFCICFKCLVANTNLFFLLLLSRHFLDTPHLDSAYNFGYYLFKVYTEEGSGNYEPHTMPRYF